MHPRRRKCSAWIVALGALGVATRLSGDHLHLCFDGSEPPVVVHGVDGGRHHGPDDHHDTHAGLIDHEDSELDLPGFTVGKAKPTLADGALVAATLRILVESRIEPHARAGAPDIPGLIHRPFLRPPTRGPPASRHA
jgi:hypothetical protein